MKTKLLLWFILYIIGGAILSSCHGFTPAPFDWNEFAFFIAFAISPTLFYFALGDHKNK